MGAMTQARKRAWARPMGMDRNNADFPVLNRITEFKRLELARRAHEAVVMRARKAGTSSRSRPPHPTLDLTAPIPLAPAHSARPRHLIKERCAAIDRENAMLLTKLEEIAVRASANRNTVQFSPGFRLDAHQRPVIDNVAPQRAGGGSSSSALLRREELERINRENATLLNRIKHAHHQEGIPTTADTIQQEAYLANISRNNRLMHALKFGAGTASAPGTPRRSLSVEVVAVSPRLVLHTSRARLESSPRAQTESPRLEAKKPAREPSPEGGTLPAIT